MISIKLFNFKQKFKLSKLAHQSLMPCRYCIEIIIHKAGEFTSGGILVHSSFIINSQAYLHTVFVKILLVGHKWNRNQLI